MSDPKTRIATLITNPSNPILTPQLGDKVQSHINASAIYWLCDGVACDFVLPTYASEANITQNLRQLFGTLPIDIIIQDQDTRRKKLLLADMDSTMIMQECIDELAEEAGLRDHVANITKRAMNGEIEFEPALRERVALLKNLPVTIIDDVITKRITLMKGGKELIATMRKNGAYTALVSGGFTLFTKKIANILGFNEDSANELLVDGDKLSGFVREPILGKQAKLDKLNALCKKLNIEPEQAMAVGDGANDLAMLQKAGSGVALHAKPIVAESARFRVDYGDLTALLYIQGYKKRDFVL